MHRLRRATAAISLTRTNFSPFRTLSTLLKPLPSPPQASTTLPKPSSTFHLHLSLRTLHATVRPPSRTFCSRPSTAGDSETPAAIDYQSVLQEDEFHKLADSTIHHLLEKLEEYGDSVDIDGLDIDYGNEVLTLKLGDLGTYVVNKQTPNRQIWLSSPLSGPVRFDWDRDSEAWIYRRTKVNLLRVLESELEKLCGVSVDLS